MSIITKSKVSDVEYNLASSAYCTCSTAKGTAAKVAYLQGDSTKTFALVQGITVHVKFTNSNTVASPTLSINGTEARPIMQYGTTAASTSTASSWRAGAVVAFTYDGTNWVMNTAIDSNSDTKVTQAAATTEDGNYPILLGYAASTAAVTQTVKKASTLTYNPSTKVLNVDSKPVATEDYVTTAISTAITTVLNADITVVGS